MDRNPPSPFRENFSFSLPASSRWREENVMHPGRYRAVMRSNEFYYSNLGEIGRKKVCEEDEDEDLGLSCLKVLPNGLLSTGQWGTVCIRSSNTLEQLSSLDVIIGNQLTQPYSLEIIDNESLAFSDGRGSIYAWNFEMNQTNILERLSEGNEYINHQLTSLGSAREILYTCSSTGFLSVIDLRNGQVNIRKLVCNKRLNAIACSTSYIATGGSDGKLRIYDMRRFGQNALPYRVIHPPKNLKAIAITDCHVSDLNELLILYRGQNGYYLEDSKSNTFHALAINNLAISTVQLKGLQFVGKHCIVCPNLETNLHIISKRTRQVVRTYNLEAEGTVTDDALRNFQPAIMDYNHEVGLLAMASGVNLMTMAGPDYQEMSRFT